MMDSFSSACLAYMCYVVLCARARVRPLSTGGRESVEEREKMRAHEECAVLDMCNASVTTFFSKEP